MHCNLSLPDARRATSSRAQRVTRNFQAPASCINARSQRSNHVASGGCPGQDQAQCSAFIRHFHEVVCVHARGELVQKQFTTNLLEIQSPLILCKT